MRYKKMRKDALLSELRLYEIEPSKEISNESLIKAMTVNAEINNLGFTLLPKDIIKLASDPNPENFLNLVKEMYEHKGYKPMYPGFPEEVMEMDEAVYRFHQALYYLSTYGVEALTGENVDKGWMPNSQYEEKTGEELRLKDLTVIELANKEEILDRIEKYIINKKERWTTPETILANDYFAERLDSVCEIPFKENIVEYYKFLKEENNPDILNKMNQICKHTGDVLDLIHNSYQEKTHIKHPFKTSERRLFSKLLDRYSSKDLSENLIREKERNKHLLNLISYNKFSRNPENMKVVDSLRAGELRSWNSYVEEKIKNHADDTLEFIAKRPGEYFRKIRWLLREGYNPEEVRSHINGKDLKTQSIVSALNNSCNVFSNDSEIKENTEEFVSVAKELLVESLSQYKTPLTDKKVYFDKTQYSPENSIVCIDKADEGGYIRSGLAFSIPESVDIVREFVFWNDDKKRVDLDLHSTLHGEDGRALSVGWNSHYNVDGVTMSGDVTTSHNSAEYIDVDIKIAKESNIENVTFLINDFNGDMFKNVEKCYFGITAAREGSKASLYDPKNLYFHHDLTSCEKKTLEYGVFSLTSRTLRLFSEKENSRHFYNKINFSLGDYLELLAKAQNITFVHNKDEAEITVTLDKKDGSYCLIDKNFLLEGDKEYVEQERKDSKFVGTLEECNELLKEHGGCMGKEGDNFFWKAPETVKTINKIIENITKDVSSYHKQEK